MAQSIELITRKNAVLDAWKQSIVFDSMGSKFCDKTYADIVDNGTSTIFSVNDSARAILIQPFEALIRGRQIRLESAVSISLSLLTGIKYITVYAFLNLVNGLAQVASIEVDANAGTFSTFTSDDPSAIQFAEIRAPLFRFIWNATTGSSSGLEQVASFINPGETFRSRSMQRTGKIDSTPIASLLEEGQTGYWNNARVAMTGLNTPKIRNVDMTSEGLVALPKVIIKSSSATIDKVDGVSTTGDKTGFWIQEGRSDTKRPHVETFGRDCLESEYELLFFFVRATISVAEYSAHGLFEEQAWHWCTNANNRSYSAIVQPGGKIGWFAEMLDYGHALGLYMYNEKFAGGALDSMYLRFPDELTHPWGWLTVFPSINVYTESNSSSRLKLAYNALIEVTPIVRKR